MAAQLRGDTLEIHPVAADLHLVVESAEDLQLAIRSQPP